MESGYFHVCPFSPLIPPMMGNKSERIETITSTNSITIIPPPAPVIRATNCVGAISSISPKEASEPMLENTATSENIPKMIE